jgi:nucleoside phosphorylase
VVVALQARDGTRNAASLCTDIVRSYPGVRAFIMSGIAGGIPSPRSALQRIQLGDIVVATKGIVDYDHVRTVDGADTLRQSVTGISAALLRADHELEAKSLAGQEPWRALLEDAETRAEIFRRPPGHTDPMRQRAADVTSHEPERQDGPHIHRGAIGSADRLLRDATLRDALASRYGIAAVEMEGSGIAVGADLHERSWFVVRGVADYCDNVKNDAWHPYAALASAVYVRALLAECHPFASVPVRPAAKTEGLHAIVDGLLSLQPGFTSWGWFRPASTSPAAKTP